MKAPHDLDVEAAALGCAIATRPAREQVLELNVEDFYMPRHQHVFAAIARLHGAGQPVDALTVSRELDKAGLLDECGGKAMVTELIVAAPVSSSAGAYVTIIADLAARRRLMAAASDVIARAEEPDADLDELLGGVAQWPDVVRVPTSDVAPAARVIDVIEAARHREHRFLVPDWIERQDRTGVTGFEGAGKTTLLRQWAVQMASGINPLLFSSITPLGVLYVDLQDTADQAGSEFDRLVATADGRFNPDLLHLVNWREGIDLRSRRDFRRLDRLMEIHQPDVLMIGPHYKTYKLRGGERSADEQPAIEASLALDELLARHDAALFIEMHCPHGDGGDRAGLRPFGPSLWLRWPEFGIGLKPERGSNGRTVDVVEWRGARDRRRLLPRKFRSGGRWPWQPVLDGEF